jgi:hypothetical protein
LMEIIQIIIILLNKNEFLIVDVFSRSPGANQVRDLSPVSHMGASSASWLSSGRACMCETRRVF